MSQEHKEGVPKISCKDYEQGFKDACDVLIESLDIAEDMGYKLVKIEDIKKIITDHLKSKLQ